MAAVTVTCPLPPDAPRPGREGPLHPPLGLSGTGVWSLPCSALARLFPPGLTTLACRLVVQSGESLSLSRPPLLLGNLNPGLPRWVAFPFTSGCADEERVPWAPAQGGLEHTGAGQALCHPRSQISAAAGTREKEGRKRAWPGLTCLLEGPSCAVRPGLPTLPCFSRAQKGRAAPEFTADHYRPCGPQGCLCLGCWVPLPYRERPVWCSAGHRNGVSGFGLKSSVLANSWLGGVPGRGAGCACWTSGFPGRERQLRSPIWGRSLPAQLCR